MTLCSARSSWIPARATLGRNDGESRLTEKLLRSLEDLSEEENERLWAEEALRRHEGLDTGAVKARPGKEVFRDARSRLR